VFVPFCDFFSVEMVDVKEQRICIKFCFKLGKSAAKTHQMIKQAFGDDALDQTQNYDWFNRFKNGLLHHDNAPAHTALAMQHFLASKNMTVVCHPPYSPDLAPYDFFLFPKMKIKLKGRRFDTVEEIQAESQKVLNTLTQKDFQDRF
jgi:transposase